MIATCFERQYLERYNIYLHFCRTSKYAYCLLTHLSLRFFFSYVNNFIVEKLEKTDLFFYFLKAYNQERNKIKQQREKVEKDGCS